MKPRLFTGIQPTGQLHIGNYLGVIKNSIQLQEKYDSLFCVVDLHALTVKQDAKTFKNSILEVARHYLASGIDPEKAILFIQSSVSEHTELCWILNTLVKISELERMTQFKEKALKNHANLNMGLFDYPILMAADILLYNTAVVPVGDDQKQHLEMTRLLANRFNKKYAEIFIAPKPLIKKHLEGGRIMGLDDPTKKMSKTAESEYNYIALTDSPEKGIQKIMKATTDSGSTIAINKANPGITNLLTIYSLLTNLKIEDLEKKYLGKQYSEFKKDLAELVGKFLQDHQEKLKEYSDSQLTQILATGSQKAQEIASQKMKEIKLAVGLN
ncbi:MAG: tryptophan--tRNA ligase [Patescibacteria group bacterium]|nr:tryptophan--tRNA ligase [Patescibacteria group bacterium]